MASFRLSRTQRNLYADRLIDLYHLVFGGMVIGQFISDKPFSFELALAGALIVVFLYWRSYIMTRVRRK